MRFPTTSMRLRSRPPTPNSSASRIVLSQVSNGAVPRSAMGSKPITAVPTASTHTALVPAISRRGFTCRERRLGPSLLVIDSIPSTMANSIGRAAARSATQRGTLYPPSRGLFESISPGELLDGWRLPE